MDSVAKNRRSILTVPVKFSGGPGIGEREPWREMVSSDAAEPLGAVCACSRPGRSISIVAARSVFFIGYLRAGKMRFSMTPVAGYLPPRTFVAAS